MTGKESDFPVYRKYPGDRTYFKIVSTEYFEEIKRMGNYYQVHTYEAAILPDRNLIQDMLELNGPYWETASEQEYEAFKTYCEQYLSPLS
jgi:hypothetical protein